MATHQLDDDIKKLMKEMNPIKINEDESFLETRLRLLDIHFNWDLWQMAPQSDSPESVVSRLQEKIEELVEHTEFKFLNFNLQLIIAQELMKYDLSNGLQKIRDCEQLLKCHKSNNCQEYLFTTIFKAMEYIVMGCKAFALFKCGIISETKEILQNLPSCNEMNDKERSGVFGMKACAYMEYGINGFHKAFEYINEARTRDPLMPDWHFLTSKVMGRIRRFKFPFLPIPEDEEKFCRTAYELRSDNPTYMMYIAQITREKASKLFNEYRNENPRKMSKNDPRKMLVDNLNREASSLYQKLILKENDSHILCRSAFGMVKLPEPYRCLDLAVEAIEKALKISPNNPMANHYAGLIYIRHLKDNENGMKYLQIAASLNAYGAHADLLRLKYSLDRKNYDPIPELTDLLKYKDNTGTTYTQIASWYFFNKVDLFKAWQYLKKVTIDPSPRAHKSLFLRMNNPCDLFEVMFDEVKLRLAQRKYESENERESLMAMGVELRKLCPDAHPFHYERLKIAILNKSDQLVERESKPNYNRGPRGGRGRGRGRGRGVGRGGGDRNVSDFFGGFKKDKSSSRDRSRTSKERTSFGNERNRDRKNSAEKYATSRQRTPSSSRNRNSQTLSNNNGRNSSPSVLYNRSKPNSLEKLNFDQNLADKSLKPESPSNKSWATGCKGLVTQSQTSMEWYNSRRPRSFQDVNYKQQGRSWSSASNRWGESKNSNTYTDNKQMRFRNKSAENYCSYRDRESNNIRRSTENIARKGTETPISKLLSKKEESEKAFASWCFERTGHLPVVSNSSAESNFLPDFAKK